MSWQTRLRGLLGLGEQAGVETSAAPAEAVREQLSVAGQGTSALTQEDWYWGPLPRGTEEDVLWRRLSDNWYQKDSDPPILLILNSRSSHTTAHARA
jgi:hypothetical protein